MPVQTGGKGTQAGRPDVAVPEPVSPSMPRRVLECVDNSHMRIVVEIAEIAFVLLQYAEGITDDARIFFVPDKTGGLRDDAPASEHRGREDFLLVVDPV